MDILGSIGSVVGIGTSAATGGLFGLVGNIASKALGFFENKQSFDQERARWSHETELLQLQMKAKAEETEHEIAIAASAGSYAGLTQSLKAEAALTGGHTWVNDVRALVRPVLTLGLAGFLCFAFFAMTPGDIDRAYVADSLVFAAVTAIVWWFGDRAPKRALK